MSKVKTKLVRFVYCHLAEPHAFAEGQDAKYSVNILIDKKDSTTIGVIKSGYNAAIQEGVEKFGQSFQGKATPLKREPGTTRGLLIDCDQDDRYATSEFAGKYMLAVKSNRPVSVGYRKNGVTYAYSNKDEIMENVYSGCYGAITFNLYPFNKVGSGIAAGLNSVLKVKDGEHLGGQSSVTSDFADASEFDDDAGSDNFDDLI